MFWWGALVGIGQGLVIWLTRHVNRMEREENASKPIQHPAGSDTGN